MKSILIISFSNLKHDARVSRQIVFLKNLYQVTVACFDAEEGDEFRLIKLERVRLTPLKKLFSGFFLLTRFYKKAYQLLYPYSSLPDFSNKCFDLILANDVETLPLSFLLKGQAKILFDAHEYAPRHFEEKLMWRIFFQGFNKHLCQQFIPKVDEMITINTGLAREYEKNYLVKPKIITNANYFMDLEPSPVSKNRIRLVHHGAANPSRRLELMVELMDYLDERFTLDMVLLTPPTANKKTRGYLDHLKSLIVGKPQIRILPPVRSDEVVNFIHQYDIGICFVPHINFNYAHGLPNKLYDYIQARLAIAIGPTEEMTNLVKTYDTGVVSDDFNPKHLASHLNFLTTEKVEYYKRQSHKAAKELSAEKNKEILLTLVERLLTHENDPNQKPVHPLIKN